MSSINSLLDIFQTVNTTRKNLVESLYVDEACYNEEIDDKLDKEKFEGVYPYSYLEGDENNKSIIIFKDLIIFWRLRIHSDIFIFRMLFTKI